MKKKFFKEASFDKATTYCNGRSSVNSTRSGSFGTLKFLMAKVCKKPKSADFLQKDLKRHNRYCFRELKEE